MTTEIAIRKRVRRTPEQLLAAMAEKQASLQAQLKAQQKKVAQRAAQARAAQAAELGNVVLEILGENINVETLTALLRGQTAVQDPIQPGSNELISD